MNNSKSTPASKKIKKNNAIELALDLVDNDKLEEAKEIITMILEKNPQDIEGMTVLANILVFQNKRKEARVWIDKVLNLDKNHPMALYVLGGFHVENKRWSSAIKAFEKAILHFPQDAKEEIAAAYQDLGCALWESRRREEALESWKICLQYDPNNTYAKNNLKKFISEYGLPASPVGKAMDDAQAFLKYKMLEYLSIKRKDGFDTMDETNKVLDKITKVWNNKIASKYGRKLDKMSSTEKKNLFRETRVFF
ncbi:MAG: hypothetical protein L0H53_16410 [Candidatus Nitrosocosmicus sp.]|nr:hypothetical protein [Candidatus Nitrosocosmicus sp.]MDN5868972.1 hypothetical protein [Candidatus Nitrosocosmicus sp.]